MAEEKQLKTKFTGLTLKGYHRISEGTTASMSSNLTADLIRSMGWTELLSHQKSVELDGSLAAKTITLNGAGTLSSFEVSIEAQSVGNFEGVRREIEGKKQKGFRHELHFKVKSADRTAGRDLEKFITSIPEGKGTMIVMHSPTPPKQEELDGIKADPDVQAELLKN
jgi:hypothetical protein